MHGPGCSPAKKDRAIYIESADSEAANEFSKSPDAQLLKLQIEIEKAKVKKWDGSFPANIVPENSQFIFALPTGNLTAPKAAPAAARAPLFQVPAAAAPAPAPAPASAP